MCTLHIFTCAGPTCAHDACACSRQSATWFGEDGKPIFAYQEISDRCVKGAFGQLSVDSCYAEATVGAPTAVECANLLALPMFAKASEVLKVVHASQQLRAQCEALTSKVSAIRNPLGHSCPRLPKAPTASLQTNIPKARGTSHANVCKSPEGTVVQC